MQLAGWLFLDGTSSSVGHPCCRRAHVIGDRGNSTQTVCNERWPVNSVNFTSTSTEVLPQAHATYLQLKKLFYSIQQSCGRAISSTKNTHLCNWATLKAIELLFGVTKTIMLLTKPEPLSLFCKIRTNSETEMNALQGPNTPVAERARERNASRDRAPGEGIFGHWVGIPATSSERRTDDPKRPCTEKHD